MINDDEDEDDVEYVDPAELRQGLEEIIASGNNNPPDTSSPLPRLPDNVIVNIGGQGCKKCGSTTHKRSNHKDCPYNKQRQNFVSPTTCQSSKACKKCGGQDHQRSNHKNCPYRKTSKAVVMEDEDDSMEDNLTESDEENVDSEEGVDSEESVDSDEEENDVNEEEDEESENADSEEDDECEENDKDKEGSKTDHVEINEKEVMLEKNEVPVASIGVSCTKCGSRTHRRSNHKDCPYNKNRISY